MFRGSRDFRNFPSSGYKKVGRWHKVAMILALAFFIGGMGSVESVAAAPVLDETIDSFDISISPVPNPACAHSLYDIQYFARVDRVADLKGQKVNLKGGLGPSEIFVNASSSDPGVADFHPNELTASAMDNLIGRGADFKLKTEAPGSATITFTGKTEWTGNRVIFPPLQQPIKVVNCRFKISITSILSGFGPAVVETVTSTLTGEISGNPDATLSGDAEVTWNEQQATPCLSIVETIPPATATLEGSLSEDGESLKVHVNYDSVMVFHTATTTCGISKTLNSQSQFQAPPLSFTVPTTGGKLSQPVSLPGELTLNGTAIISVVPIEGN